MSEETSAPALGRLARVLIGTTATIALLVGAFSAYAMVSYLDASETGDMIFPADDPQEVAVGPCVEDVCNYLLLGSDSRRGLTPEEQEAFGTDENNGGVFRSDTIMLVQLDPVARRRSSCRSLGTSGCRSPDEGGTRSTPRSKGASAGEARSGSPRRSTVSPV